MIRTLITLLALCVLAPAAKSQDMPLSQILIEGEGWKKAEGEWKGPTFTSPAGGGVFSHDGQSVFVIKPGPVAAIFAFNAKIDPKTGFPDSPLPMDTGAPYCSLRTKRGQKGIEVGGMVVDKDGRIYAATEIGVQVFDPTGRLCGVLTPAAPGRPTFLAFTGKQFDQLTVWMNSTRYSRRLNTAGSILVPRRID